MPKKDKLNSAPSGKAKPGSAKAKKAASEALHEEFTLMNPMGAVAVNNTEAYVFVFWNDGNLWRCSWSGSKPSWANHGISEGTKNLWSPLGATVVGGNRPYVFTEDDNDNVVVNWLSESGDWSWSDLGQPRAGIDFEYGAVTLGADGPYVFCRGSDYDLWGGCYSDGEWGWFWQRGAPVHIWDSMGTTVINGNRPCVFVKGGDGNLWVYWWSDKGSPSWFNLGKPGGKDLGSYGDAVTVGHDASHVFFASGGNLWMRFWNPGGWSWADLGRPKKEVSVQDWMMEATVIKGNRPYVFVAGEDENLWVYWWSDKGLGSWYNLGTPNGLKIWYSEGSMGAVTLGDDNACVFMRCSDYNLWVNSESPKGRAWFNLGIPPANNKPTPVK